MPADIDFHDVYQHSPVSLWIEDYSLIRRQLEAIRDLGAVSYTHLTLPTICSV